MAEMLIVQVTKEELKSLIQEGVDQALKGKYSMPANSIQEEPLLKVDEVCKILQVSKVTVHKWKRSGKIPFHRISNRIFFKKVEILDSLKKSSSGKGKYFSKYPAV